LSLEVNKVYSLSNLHNADWDNTHKTFGQPNTLAGIYLGFVTGERTWHIFEIRYENKDIGVILMNNLDLEKITVTEL